MGTLWLNHPKYVPVRDHTVQLLQASKFKFRKLKRIVFLCGGASSSRRDAIAEYIRRHHQDFLVFYADDVWTHIASDRSQNALEMERQLAELSDVVPIVVESPGTFAELGAFGLSPELRKKLLPIVDRRYQHDESFINTGPVRWIDQESMFKPTVFANFDVVLDAGAEIDERLARLAKPKVERVEDLPSSPRHLLFFVCDLVFVIAPATAQQVSYYVRNVLGQDPDTKIESLLGLGESLGFLHSRSIDGVTYYARNMSKYEFQAFHQKRYLDLPATRGKVAEALYSIDQARTVMAELQGGS